MSDKEADPYSRLERAFHEPKRLAIVSALIAAEDGLSFSELKEQCDLTDGNLNRHLKVLDDEGDIKSKKITGTGRPRTIVTLTPTGRERFLAYLNNLEAVLKQAHEAARTVPEGGSLGSSLA